MFAATRREFIQTIRREAGASRHHEGPPATSPTLLHNTKGPNGTPIIPRGVSLSDTADEKKIPVWRFTLAAFWRKKNPAKK